MVKSHYNSTLFFCLLKVTYKNGVYDVTDFVASHPGGDKIFLAAGKSLEPFFELYGIHKTKEVMEIVEVRILAVFTFSLTVCLSQTMQLLDYSATYPT